MCLSNRAVKQIINTLTSMDIVRTLSYCMFPRTDLNLAKLGFINKALIFGTGVSTEYDCRSPKEWEDQNHRFLIKGAIPTYIVCPVLVNKKLPTGKVVKRLNGYKDANLFSISNTYGDNVSYPDEPAKFLDLKRLLSRYKLDHTELPDKYQISSYYNESETQYEVASDLIKRYIYSIVQDTVKDANIKHLPAKDAIICEIVTLSILRSIGVIVPTGINYHERISTFGLYQRYSTLSSFFQILKGCEVVFESLDLPIVEG